MKTKAVSGRSGPAGVEAVNEQGGQPTTSNVTVTVVYAQADVSWQVCVKVPAGTDVAGVVRLSGFAQAFPEYPIDAPAVGIFGRRCRSDQVVGQGDRIEIYRPLNFDPMESRRRRAAHRKAAGAQAPFRPRRVRNTNNLNPES
ncbi:MAG TPA: RnfH family protein [Pusillimonas sp.]|uniref:RnfH family protein n=1 Tax=Pusillimonas sp. TaxID=3040095 RepID=UPI002CBB3836|nr:RnfH family protein [Pusillimonas sp.]HUH86752.1 RnfH family protein [Pusillimonas sp.]